MIGVILIPPVLAAILDLFQKPEDVLPRQHVDAVLRSAGRHVVQAVFTVVCLPYEAFFSLDAIVRTIWRMLVTQTATAGMESVKRSGSRSPHRPRRLLSDDVDRRPFLPLPR